MIRFFKPSIFLFSLLLVLFLIPGAVFAAPDDFPDLVRLLVSLINLVVSVIIVFAVLGFFWGLSKYVLSAQDSTKMEEGRKIMMYGFIGLFVMVSMWGILQILSDTFLNGSSDSSWLFSPF